MTLLRLTPLALSRSRFALSPLAETLGAIRALSGYGGDPWLAAWHRRHRAAFSQALERDPFAAGLIGLLNATTWLPGFVAVPPPHGMRTTIAQELAQLRRATDEQVAGELKEAVVNGGVRQSLDGWLTGQDWGPRIAELLGTVWSRHVQPDWSRRRALLERDVTYRAGLLAAYGWPHALARMNRRSAWVGADAIRISDRPSPDRVVGDDGMLFVPVSQPRGTWLCESPPDRYALVYPPAARRPSPNHPTPPVLCDSCSAPAAPRSCRSSRARRPAANWPSSCGSRSAPSAGTWPYSGRQPGQQNAHRAPRGLPAHGHR